MKKILFITSEMRYGGAEKMIAFLANSLSNLDYDVTIYSYEGENQNYKLSDKIKHSIEKNISKTPILKRFVQIVQVRKQIKVTKPDLVISFLTNQNVFSIIGTSFTNIPVIISERGDPTNNTSFVSKLKYFFYNFADGLVFQTKEASEMFNKNIKAKSVVIHNPVVVPNIEFDPQNSENSVAHVGRFDIAQKRQDVLINAFKIVNDIYPDTKLLLYGDGPDEGIITDLIKKLNLQGSVILKGKVDNVIHEIMNSKLFILTSDYEGIPNALIEAMSIGLPVISTDCSPGGAKLLIDNYVNGILVPIRDEKAISSAIIELIENPEQAEALGLEAKKIISKFDEKEIISQWVKYLEKI